MSLHRVETPLRPTGFRAKLLITMMLVITALTAVVIVVAERNLTANVEDRLQSSFRAELETFHHGQELRQAALLERVRTLVRRARLHAAIEDDALDLLYPSATDELRDLMGSTRSAVADASTAYSLRAEFYRFLDRTGSLIPVQAPHGAGELDAADEAKLRLPQAPLTQQIGYFIRSGGVDEDTIVETIAMPIVSLEDGSVIAALALGFDAAALGRSASDLSIKRGVWVEGRLHMNGLSAEERAAIDRDLTQTIAAGSQNENGLPRLLGSAPHLLFYKHLNPGSLYPPAYEVCVYPLAELAARKRQIRWQVVAVGALLLLGGLGASHVLAGRLSVPVEKLAVDSAEDRLQRERAEAALESTHAELQRAARFSADASHQLKTPVAVMRAGLEELKSHAKNSPETADEISALIHQTFRLSGVIDDLLLLSRMDAGRLRLAIKPVDLRSLIDAALDDLGAQPDAGTLSITTTFPPDLEVLGDEHYIGLILQNLLDNARKYNRPAGRIDLTARNTGGELFLRVGNTGRVIGRESREHIFERFHRGSMGENVPGYGLGLNLARELARLHRGDLQLLRSEEDWTEFEVRFRAPSHPSPLRSDA